MLAAGALCDTGPLLHLHEIDCLDTLAVFDQLTLAPLVVAELERYGIDLQRIEAAGVPITVAATPDAGDPVLLRASGQPLIQPADAQVLSLAESAQFQVPVLTDDLTLRRIVETRGATVTGSVGIVVRAYSTGRLSRGDLMAGVDALFERSTLHLSPAFRAFIRQLLAELP